MDLKINHIQHIGIPVSNIQKSIAFYEQFGFKNVMPSTFEIEGEKAVLYINNQKTPSFLVQKMLGTSKNGSVALWVEIGTIGYFKDLKVIKKS